MLYYASFCVDIEVCALKKIEFGNVTDKDELKRLRTEARKYKGFNKLLTPMAKYYGSEMSMRVSNGSMAILGGSGYMKDYPVERYLRDSRITTIYEGTSQLQVIAAIAGVTSGAAAEVVEELLAGRQWSAEIAPLIEQLRGGVQIMKDCVAFVKAQPGNSYKDLYARKLVDIGVYLVIGALFCDYATASAKKLLVAKRWLADKMPQIRMNQEQILSGNTLSVTEFDTLAGPVPVLD